MLKEESIWIRKVLEEIDLSSVNDVLDVGSSTKEFRTHTQPYIDENIFKPLREQNISICYLDTKNSEGIDLVFDVENISAEEIGKTFDMIICCSLLEHVQKPKRLASLLVDLVRQDGFLLVTVPQSYRYHQDPIDTMFRPSMKDLVSIFHRLQIIRKATIRVKDKEKYRLSEFIRYIVPFFNWKVNCLFMKKGKL
jgi:SAM-dependent methyltransferase